MTDALPVDTDAVYELMAHERRRHLLYLLCESDVATVETLSRTLAAHEEGAAPRSVSDTAIDRVGISLVHDHLPRLADHGLCEFDARSGDVVPVDSLDTLRPTLESALDVEVADGHTERTPLSVLYSEPSEDRFLVEDA